MRNQIRRYFAACAIAAVVCLAAGRAASAEGYDEVAGWMAAQKQATGHAAGYSVMAEKMAAADARLSPEERTRLWTEWKAAQRATITQADIVEAAKAKRASIKSVRITYVTPTQGYSMDGKQRVEDFNEKTFFLMKGDMLRTDKQRQAADETFGPPNIMTYDGQVMRWLYRQKDNPVSGNIQAFHSRSIFFDPKSVLGSQMMLDNATDDPRPGLIWHDLAYFFQPQGGVSTVAESEEMVDGRKALVCTHDAEPMFVIWLDPERNYAVLKQVENKIQYVEKDGKYIATGLVPDMVIENKDFFDAGGGVWMPRREVFRWLNEDGSTWREETTEVEKAEINGAVADSEFKDVFPNGTPVIDNISRTMYTQGELDALGHGMSGVLNEMKSEARVEATGATSVTAAEPAAKPSGRPMARGGAATSRGRGALAVIVIVVVAIAALAAVAILRAKRSKS